MEFIELLCHVAVVLCLLLSLLGMISLQVVNWADRCCLLNSSAL